MHRRVSLIAAAALLCGGPSTSSAQTFFTDRDAWLAALGGIAPTPFQLSQPVPSGGTYTVCDQVGFTPANCPTNIVLTGQRYQGFEILNVIHDTRVSPIAPFGGRIFVGDEAYTDVVFVPPAGVTAISWVLRPLLERNPFTTPRTYVVQPQTVRVTTASGAVGTVNPFGPPYRYDVLYPDPTPLPDRFLGVIADSPITQVRIRGSSPLVTDNGFVDIRGMEFVTTATPEPATLVLVASGALLVGAIARRRRV